MSRSGSQFSKSARGSTFASIIDAEITENQNVLNIIDFLDSPLGPPVTLYPVQRIIAKAIYGVPMDYKSIKVPVYDKHKDKLLFQMSEPEFVNYLADVGRVNVKDWRDLPQRGFNEAVILAGRRGGKALGVNELIPTPVGFKKMGDLQDGDMVFGPDGNPTRVKYAHPSFKAETYRVHFDDLTSVVTHGGHLWFTFTSEDPKGCVKTTEDILKTIHLGHFIPLADPIDAPVQDLPVHPYVLGLMLGDEGLEGLSESGDRHIPEEYLWASKVQRIALLEGLMSRLGVREEDLCVYRDTPEMAEDVFQLVASLGMKPTKYLGVVSWDEGKQEPRRVVCIEPTGIEEEVRCITVDREDGLFLFGRNFNITHNSQLVSALACYKLYRLLSIRNPQEYYGLVDGSVIDFTFLAQDEDGAQRLYTKMRQDVNQSSFFSPYIKSGSGTSKMQFVTESDRGKRDVLPSINVESHPCTTRSARGPSALFLAFDEFAHFRSATGSSSDEVYEAASPAVANFKNPNDGTLDSLIVSITSPWTRVGKLWSLWQDAMTYGVDSGVFAIRVSTAEMNPGVPKEVLTKAYRTSPLTWQAEYGGEFLDSSESYVANTDLLKCVDEGRKNVTSFSMNLIGKHYFWGLDLGFKKDASALAVCHWEYNTEGQLVLMFDYVDRMMVGEKPYENVTELPVNDVFRWLQEVNALLPGAKGATDQHGGSMFTQLASQIGLDFIELVHFTSGLNSQMYYVLKGFISQNIIRLPDEPKLITEIQNLEATYTGKYSIKVEAPPEKNAHDDMADAVALAAWQANNWLMTEGKRYLGDAAISTFMSPMMPGQGSIIPDLDAIPLSQLRVMERTRMMSSTLNPEGGMLSPRLALRRR